MRFWKVIRYMAKPSNSHFEVAVFVAMLGFFLAASEADAAWWIYPLIFAVAIIAMTFFHVLGKVAVRKLKRRGE